MDTEADDPLMIEALETPLPIIEAHLAKAGLLDFDRASAYPAAAEFLRLEQASAAPRERAFGVRAHEGVRDGPPARPRMIVSLSGPEIGFFPAARRPGLAGYVTRLRRMLARLFARSAGGPTGLEKVVGALPVRLRIVEETATLACLGIPAADSRVASTKEMEIRSVHRRMLDELRESSSKRLRRARTGLDDMLIDDSEAGINRIRAEFGARLENAVAGFASESPGLARHKVHSERELAAFRLLHSRRDSPTARSALAWLAAVLVTASVEALANALLFKAELGYLNASGFALGIGGAIALIGVFGGIGLAQLRRPRLPGKAGGLALVGAAIGSLLFLILGVGHYRDALARQGADFAAAVQAVMATSPFAPFGDFSLLPYFVLSVAGFAFVCWKSITMWEYLDLRRLEVSARRAVRRLEEAREKARARCDVARANALNRLDAVLEAGERHVQRGDAIVTACEQIRDEFAARAEMVSDSLALCEQNYREVLEACHPAGRGHARLAAPVTRLPQPELAQDRETQFLHALEARLVRIREALPGMSCEIGEATGEATERIDLLAFDAEAAARHGQPTGDNLVLFERRRGGRR